MKRRKVVRVSVAYIVVGWLVIQVATSIFPTFNIPDWASRMVILCVMLGFPITVIIAWAFELTPEGLKITQPVSQTGEVESAAHNKKRNWFSLGLAAAVPTLIFGALALFFYFQSGSVPEQEKVVADQVAAVEDDKSIAVLPFTNRSELKSDEFFTDGIHDDLLTQISRIPGLKTISRTSVMAYKGTTMNMREIGEELGVATLLEGGVQRAGDTIRINMQLIDAKTDAHLWADTYTREMTAENIFAIQTEVTLAIASALKAILSPEEQQQMEEDLPTGNLAALEAFFKGKEYFNQANSNGYNLAIVEFEKAIKLDESFANAHALLAYSHMIQTFYSGAPVDVKTVKAQPHIDRAIELNPNLAMAYVALGNLEKYNRRPEASRTAYRKAIELNPNLAMAYQDYGNLVRWFFWELKAANELFARAHELDPKNPGAAKEYAESLFSLRRDDEAVALLEDIIEENPEFAQAYEGLASYYTDTLYRPDKSVKALRQAYAYDPGSPFYAGMLGTNHMSIGSVESAVFWFDRAITLAPNGRDVDVYRGLLEISRGNIEGAMLHFLRVTDEADLRTWAYFWLANYAISSGQSDKVVEQCFEHNPSLQSETPEFSNWWMEASCARALYSLGRLEQSTRIATAMLNLMETEPRKGPGGYQFLKVLLYSSMGDRAGALAAYQAFVNDDVGVSPLIMAAKLLGEYEQDPEFVHLTSIMEARMVEMRANVDRMEANDELAFIPSAPAKN